MLWGSKEHKDTPEEAHPPAPGGQLSPHLQKLLDREDTFYDDVYTPYSVDSTETPYRYAGYANRLRTLLLSAHRYVAYTSDIGESFRPVAHPYLVRTAYGISWSYILGDVLHEGYKAYLRNRRVLAPPGESYKDASSLASDQVVMGMATGNINGSLHNETDQPGSSSSTADTLTPWSTTRIPLIDDYRVVMAQRAVFQSIASMGLPAFTIHSVVKHSGRMLKNQKNTFLRTWTPIGLGLAVVPFLPYLFDEPVEEAVEWCFQAGLRAYAGEDAVRRSPVSHLEEDATSLSRFLKVQEKGASSSTTEAAKVSWDEYKDELRRAREQRKREREEKGHTGPLALLGFGGSSSSPKEKSE